MCVCRKKRNRPRGENEKTRPSAAIPRRNSDMDALAGHGAAAGKRKKEDGAAGGSHGAAAGKGKKKDGAKGVNLCQIFNDDDDDDR